METRKPDFSVMVDVTNPGEFFACCGLLELAHRLWPGAEGWFADGKEFHVSRPGTSPAQLEDIISPLRSCEITGLTAAERKERQLLEEQKRSLRKKGQNLNPSKEAKLKELGKQAREGEIRIGCPFEVLLDWWNDEQSPTTWAGRQELHKIARSAQDALPAVCGAVLFNHSRVLRKPKEYRKKPREGEEKVEPFYFDARRFAPRLNAGFSLDVQGAEAAAYPAVELLTLIGLQRFRPTFRRPAFEYCSWACPLPVSVASAEASGALNSTENVRYRFLRLQRDDQNRYKAFGFASRIGE